MLTHDDMHRVLGFMPKDVMKILKASPLFVAGGYIRARIAGEAPSDIDILAPSIESAELHAKALAAERDVKSYRTRNAWTILSSGRIPIQFIHRWTFSDAETLIASFDFTIAKAAIWWDAAEQHWHSTCDPAFYPDLAAKRLVYTNPQRNEDAGGSMLRVQKFLKRGYDISPENLGKVIGRLVNGIEPDSHFWQRGDDIAKAKVITSLLRHVDPLVVIDGLEPSDDSLEDKPA